MAHDLIGAAQLHQTVPSVPWLASRCLLAFGALAVTLSPWTITRRGLAAVMAIFGQLPFEFLNALQRLAQLLQRLGQLLSQGVVLCFQLSDSFLCCHGFIVAVSAIPPELLHIFIA